MLVKRSLSPSTIELTDSVDSAEAVIRLLSAKVAGELGIQPAIVELAVLDRERTRSTAFSNGGAMPHCRLPQLKRFAIGLAVLRKPVRWDNDGHAVDTVMLIAGPSENVSDHLRILTNGSQLLDSLALRSKLRQAPSPAAVCELLGAAEEALEQRRSQVGILREVRREPNGHDYLAEVAAGFNWA